MHRWPKNANHDRIILQESAERCFGLFSHLVLDQYLNIYATTRFHIRKWPANDNEATTLDSEIFSILIRSLRIEMEIFIIEIILEVLSIDGEICSLSMR